MIHHTCSAASGPCDKHQSEASNQCCDNNSVESSPMQSPLSALPLSSPLAQLPDAVYSFFKDVPTDGYPEESQREAKAQPWRELWGGPKPSSDGRLMIALPRRTDFGSNNLGGY